MTLSSLLHNDGPMLTITSQRDTVESNMTYGWSDIPLFACNDELISTLPTKPNSDIANKPLELTTTSLYTSQSTPDFSSSSMLSYTAAMFDAYIPQPSPISPVVSRSHTQGRPARAQHCRKNVSFSRFLEIREHSVTVGDHPCCEALPLSLAWEHAAANQVSLEEFESQRVGQRRPARLLRLSYLERKNILRRIAGFTEADLTNAHTESRREFTLHHVSKTFSLGEFVL